MQSMVVNVAENSAGTDTVGTILGINKLAEAVHDHSAVLPLALLLILLRLQTEKLVNKSHYKLRFTTQTCHFL